MTPRNRAQRTTNSKLSRLGVAGLVLLAVALLAPTADLRVAQVSGDVEIGRGEPPVWHRAGDGEALSPGDVVRTGREGRAELVLGTGTVRLYGDSLLRVPADAMGPRGPEAVELDRGTSLFDVLRTEAGDPFEVRTREVVVSVKGTRFAVDLAEEGPAVAVYRGTVGVRGLAAQLAREVLVREGFAAVGGASGVFELIPHPAQDPWDGWSRGLPPELLPREGHFPSPPAKAAVSEAKEAARRSYRAGAVREAVNRRPELAERVAEVARERKREIESAAPADRATDRRDGIADAPQAELKKEVAEQFIASWLTSDADAGDSGPGSDDFEIDIDDETILVRYGAEAWSFDDDQLEDILEGEESFPAGFENLVLLLGNDPRRVAEFLLKQMDYDD